MNLFILDENHRLNAQYHIDAHCNKIILEATQMLCTAINLSGKQSPYKTTHQNHPVSKWVRESTDNFNWTLKYATELCNEFEFRRNKTHGCLSVLRWVSNNYPTLPNVGLTSFIQAMPVQYQRDSVVEAYRTYYLADKQVDKNGKNMFVWTNRNKPDWVNNEQAN